MAPVALELQPSYAPLALATLHLSSAAYLTWRIARGLYRSNKELGPAQGPRHRISQRQKLTTAFGSLAYLSLALAVGAGISYLRLSYSVWAAERGVDVPSSLFGNGTESAGLHVTRWLSETPVYVDALEIIAEKSRRLWWGQQLDIATVSWITLLAIEGRRRKIHSLWAYALLSHLVSLSFAQNLFYVAMLLTPSPITVPAQESRFTKLLDRAFPPKPTNWTPNPSLLVTALVLNYVAIFSAPYTVGTSSFTTVASLAKIFSFLPLVLPTVVPESWGTVHSHPRDAYAAYTKISQVMSLASILLHAKTTIAGLFYNLPESYKHRHSLKIPFDTEKRSKWERSATAIEKVLGSMTDHPVVRAAGQDVLVSALSLGLWAAVRSMDVGDMLHAAVPSYKASPGSPAEEASKTSTKAEEAASSEPTSELSVSLRSRGLPAAKPAIPSITISNGLSDEGTPRRRGRPRKIKQEPEPEPEPNAEPDLEEVPGDETYQPTAGEEATLVQSDVVPDDDFDWESASLAWGLTALGGLGAGSAAVFGAECVGR
ncbi:hypothetical protein B0T22DRAFT_447426 [Podospora appendiculata]|uniref:Uncharacterized protein n=1 Tax=Podospora appendiculata TaxID=314037 RepID=A0AAE0XFJ7_9PEZI|nr:hypothetical protein B0T22DRAFT_447426 [Podospora appendiculata]